MGSSGLAALPPFFWPLGEGNEPPGRAALTGTPLGHDEGTFLVVQEDGSVVSVDPSGHHPPRFVNRTTEMFSQSLELARREWSIRRDLDEVAADAQVARWRDEVANTDPAATADPETWWSLILEQCEHGLL